jgi:glutathione S-transferase
VKLRFSPISPFVRKVLVFAHEINVRDQIDLVPTDVWDPQSDIVGDNPLGKVPALVTEHGALVGSLLCCEYLQHRNPKIALIPAEFGARLEVLRLHAIADGMTEAAVLHAVERFRRPKEFIYAGQLERQQSKIENALSYLENCSEAQSGRVDLATLTIGCALEYLDLRMAQLEWRNKAPRLAAWLSELAMRPSFSSTRPAS